MNIDGIPEKQSPNGPYKEDPNPFYYHDQFVRNTLLIREGKVPSKAGRPKKFNSSRSSTRQGKIYGSPKIR